MNTGKEKKRMSQAEKNLNRVIPLTKDFMEDKKTNDIVWGFLQIHSYKTKDNKRIVYKSQAKTYDIYNYFMKDKEKTDKPIISEATIRNTIKLYKKIKIITEEKVLDNYNRLVDVYVLKQDFERFQFIKTNTLKYLVDTSNLNVIKVYTYLLNKFIYKKKNNDKYSFTKKELCESIGYSYRKESIDKLNNILTCLKNNGLIQYSQRHYYNGKVPIPILILDNVNEDYKR